ncbi:MAG: radical SAM protein [Acidobacteria bacterium]|nr:radical SAM protein [Acidobacteriota bacterium]
MVLRATTATSSYIISLKPHSLAVSRDDTLVVSWDLGGRLYCVYRDDVTWRRGLNGDVLEKQGSGASRSRSRLTPAGADAVVDEAATFARKTVEAVLSPAWRWAAPVEPVVAQLVVSHLQLCAQFGAAQARIDAARFADVYRPVGILPPDQYLSLVVQATEGCSFNTCTFCDLYHDGYRVKSADQFRAHVDRVRRYLGASISLRSRGIFLGAANALAVPMATLVPIFETLVEELDAIPRGVCAFVDGFTGTKKTAGDYRMLSHLGLRRVYIGLESGHDPLLAFIRKPGLAADAVETARRVKAAGVQVGVIVMTGLGGERFSARHVADTIAAVNRMQLGDGDLIYFSDVVEIAGTAYPRIAEREGVRPLSPEDRRAQRDAIRAGLRFDGPGPKFATYDIREFVY